MITNIFSRHIFVSLPSQIDGQTSFLFTLQELTDLYGTLPTGQEIHVNASIYDWFLMQNNTGDDDANGSPADRGRQL